jgi:hypothetical protein
VIDAGSAVWTFGEGIAGMISNFFFLLDSKSAA